MSLCLGCRLSAVGCRLAGACICSTPARSHTRGGKAVVAILTSAKRSGGQRMTNEIMAMGQPGWRLTRNLGGIGSGLEGGVNPSLRLIMMLACSF